MRIIRGAAFVLACTLGLSLTFLACGDGGEGGDGTGVGTTGTVSGRVSSSSGSGIAGATLSLQGASTRSTTSGGDGGFSFADVEAGSWTLGITPPTGFVLAAGQSASVPVTVTAGQASTVNFTLAAEQVNDARIRASVTVGGSPQQGVQLRLFQAGSSSLINTQTTGTDGTATFVGLAAGDYDVEVVPPSGLEIATGDEAKKQVTATAGQVANVSFGLQASGGGGGGNVVEIRLTSGLRFEPADVTVEPGTTIRWVNAAAIFHTVTPDGHSAWARGTVSAQGDVYEATVTSAGNFPYFCEPHRTDGMTGVIRVQ